MGVPVSQMWTVASYVLGKKLRGVKRYPLVLMLETTFSLQPRLRGLREDSVSRRHPASKPHAGAMFQGG